jgi:HEAT repeat protein
MPDRRLIEYHLARLEDKSATIRLKAIQELKLLADSGTLEKLQDVFENDPDDEVRKAAREAGRAIFLKQRDQGV